MAEQFGISKIPLIQALTLLSNERLLEKIPRKGFYVRIFSEKEIKDIFDLRVALEHLGINNLINDLNDGQKENLIDFKNKFKINRKKSKKYYDLDIQFHHFIIGSSGNDLVLKINDNFNILLTGYIKGFVLEISDSFKQHIEIIDSILDKDAERAEKALTSHIAEVLKKYNH